MRVGFCWYLDLPGFLHVGIVASKGEVCGCGVIVHELEISRLEG